jgi:cation:H+ antiporter
MVYLINIVIIVVAAFIMIKAVDLFIESSTKISRKLGISGYTISFLVVAVATSLPETLVAATSAIAENPILAYGDAMGSNIALLTLVIAIPVLAGTNISTRTILNSKDVYYTAFFSMLPVLLVVDGALTRMDGIILLSLYISYFFMVIRRAKGLERFLEQFDETNMPKEVGIFIFSLVLFLVASQGIFRAARELSLELGWGLGFVGLSITALGTSLPEITFVIASIKQNKQDEILGDVIGSVVANSTVVLGTASVIHPIDVKSSHIGITPIVFAIFSLLVFLRFVRTREKLDKIEAVTLLAIYAIAMIVEYNLQA